LEKVLSFVVVDGDMVDMLTLVCLARTMSCSTPDLATLDTEATLQTIALPRPTTGLISLIFDENGLLHESPSVRNKEESWRFMVRKKLET
jgi:hypothetical protein